MTEQKIIIFLHHAWQVLTNTADSVTMSPQFWTISNIEIPAYCIATMPRKKPRHMSTTACVYEEHVNKIMITQNPNLVTLPAIHLKNKIYLSHVP